MKKTTARFVICSITTKDADLLERTNNLRLNGETHESIYIAGINQLEKELANKK